jgi:hypothetical protein
VVVPEISPDGVITSEVAVGGNGERVLTGEIFCVVVVWGLLKGVVVAGGCSETPVP